ncbi:pentatricopeptide repeat-containing protein At1g11290, chloroplastic [Selaginella moellendorffii]|nr:pentatricopeptide repeat-containing protein At1g11290, chloroplastic [Selaginella moellendorffii]|eukprot:XP_002979199.2 pentatricopeptide repeat-containing protein At1g11290, chloroplastic [Selaginella moellendorffii]
MENHSLPTRAVVFSANSGANQRLMSKRKKNPLDHLEVALIGAGSGTYAQLLDECGRAKSVLHGKFVHQHIIDNGYEQDTFVANLVMQMYIKCGCLEEARLVFSRMVKPSLVSWTTMLSAYAQNGYPSEALKLVNYMELNGLKPDKVTLLCILGACSYIGEISRAREVHQRVAACGFDSETPIGNSLVHMYTRCGSLQDARLVFEGMTRRNVVSWNSMVAACAQLGGAKDALEVFARMLEENVQPDKVTFMNLLQAFSTDEDLAAARDIHSKIVEHGFESDVAVGTAVMSMYGKCKSLEDARLVFERLHGKNLVTWNTMISVYAHGDRPEEALSIYNAMGEQYIQPDHITFTSVLAACASIGVLQNGKRIHGHVKVFRMEDHASVATGLVKMYSQCGSVGDAREVFETMNRDLVAWNTMIAGYAQHGYTEQAVELFHKMDVIPDEVTFVSLLDACGHSGLVTDSWYYFRSMLQLGVSPTIQHFGCMVSLLGKVGKLDQAEKLILSMKAFRVEANAVVWKMFLDACKTHGNMEKGARAAAEVLRLESGDSFPYVVLANICSTTEEPEPQNLLLVNTVISTDEAHEFVSSSGKLPKGHSTPSFLVTDLA